jgi:hypothetical protein
VAEAVALPLAAPKHVIFVGVPMLPLGKLLVFPTTRGVIASVQPFPSVTRQLYVPEFLFPTPEVVKFPGVHK